MITLQDIYMNGNGAPIPGAVDVLYELLSERPPHANISHSGMPEFAKHEAFVKSKPYRQWFLILNEYGQRVGAAYLTSQNEIGISILKRYQRQGYALQALTEIRKIPPLLPIIGKRSKNYIAHVAPQNEASHALFTRAGGKPIQVTYVLE
jgi:RimJ/RimL family protein N-acetyltransferase